MILLSCFGYSSLRGVTKTAYLCYNKDMRKLWWVLLFVAYFSACAQTPPENNIFSQKNDVTPARAPRRSYLYRIESSTQILGFSVMVNGAEIMVADGGENSFNSRIDINDWMISGNNKIDITIFWPDSVKFTPGITSALFKITSNDKSIKEFKWPVTKASEDMNTYPHTFTEIFKADGFPRVLLERAERVISSAGALPREDQAEIAAIAQQLRTAFTEKDIDTIDNLLRFKYYDLATARFAAAAEIKAEADAKYRELMDKAGYTVYFNGRNSYFSAADDRAVRLGQGRIGFPEPALIITYRESGRTMRWVMDLYFAKIDGNWVIIR